jgi:tRNA dimethylallyltransferase
MQPIVIAGPTGSGKSELALRLAQTIGGEIVNYDSVQIYRGFDIGSAKPSLQTRQAIPHHLYDIVEAETEFNAADYARLAGEVCDDITARGQVPILVGGTFFYVRALLSGLPEMPGRDQAIRTRLGRIADRPGGQARLHRWLSSVDPESGRRIAPADRHRVERALEVWLATGKAISTWERPTSTTAARPALRIALTQDRPRLRDTLDRRSAEMYAAGLVEETRGLLARHSQTARPFSAIGYKEAAGVVHRLMTERDALAETQRRTRAYAKRQMTWLRSEPSVHWLNAEDRIQTLEAALRLIEVES